MTGGRVSLWSSLAGLVSAVTTLAVAEVIAVFVAPAAGPLFAVGSFVIDIVPPFVKSTVIALFGTADKVVLLASLGLLVAILAALAGILEFRKPPFGVVLLAAVGLIATVAVATRAEANLAWAIPTVVGVVVGIVILRLTISRLHDWADASRSTVAQVTSSHSRVAVNRRGFLTVLIGVAAASTVIGLGARAINAGTAAVNAVREALTLPKPAVAASAVPAGASLPVPGISPIISSNADFYRIDTALQVPSIDASTWKLKITGMVESEIEIGFDELLALPLIETYATLMCVSNEVGGNLIGNAKWLGYPIRELLKKAKPTAGADMVLSSSIDGWTASSPLDVLLDEQRDAIFAVGMNGDPLPIEHGFPVRMVVPGLYGYVSATKWVVALNVTRFADQTAYWTDRGWSAQGPIKTSSRIDVPRASTKVDAGTVAIAGVAWAQHTGIDGVEVRIDGGQWQPAKLADAISKDTWRQWSYEWDAAT
ncbi:MAG: molybdopterin-dependent oxidoreductase, partial [Rhodoglobus sp.]